MLHHHYGAYAACPPMLRARVLEIDELSQTEAIRKKFKATVSHLPLTGAESLSSVRAQLLLFTRKPCMSFESCAGYFKLCELDMTHVLPADSLAPFAREVAQRAQWRVQAQQREAKRAKRDAAAMLAAEAAQLGPGAAELRVRM